MPENLRPRAVLFDLYRTLIDITTDEQRPEVWEKLARFLRYRGLPAEPGALKQFFFAEVENDQTSSDEAHPEVDVQGIFRRMLRGLGSREPDEEFCVEVMQLFRVLSMVHFGLYRDTLSTLQALHGKYALGLVSDAQESFLEPEIRMLGLEGFFDVIIVSSHHGFHKPDPRMFSLALAQLGLEPHEAVYVGDHLDRDICGARRARLHTVLVRRDGTPEPRNPACKPDLTIRALDELRCWLAP